MSDTTSLLPPNATATERAISTCTARTTALAVGPKYRALWSPMTCPAGILPWLAWSLHVDEWDENWTEAQKRQVIADSVAVHKTKGTIGALKRALQSLGYEVTVDDHLDEVFTFRLGVNLNQTGPLTSDTFAAMRRVALANKNARSHLAAIRSELTESAGLYVGIGQYRAQTVTVDAGEYDPYRIDENTILQVQVSRYASVVERTGNGTITTTGTVIVDHATTHDGYGSIRNTETTSSTEKSGYLLVSSSIVLTGQWCIEGYLRRLTTSWNYPQAFLSSADFYIGEDDTNHPYLRFECKGSIVDYQSSFTEYSGWEHVAISYDGSTVRAFAGGILLGSISASISSFDVQSLLLGFGGPCLLENVRVSNIARYTENFTPKARF